MDKKNDVQLIRRILLGDDEAFGTLVRRHQKGIHALAWRKVGDFHVAEEIAQDTFLQVYKNLAQLKNPNQFSGWMYVIASRLCLKWLQKNKNTSVIHSLEDTPVEDIEESSYTHHVSEQRQTEITENRHELVKRLLAKLPESERTAVTLYYLGEMTAKEIGKYLGVSVNTVKSRLRRGRRRLQEQQEELLVSETLGSIQIPADFTARIMEQVANMKPIQPPVGKPLIPWAAFGTAVVLVMLMLGVSNQLLAWFQKPYSFEAESELTIEIVDAPIVLDIVSKPSIRNQFGRATIPGRINSTGIQISETASKSNMLEDSRESTAFSQWTQGSAPPGGHVRSMFATSEGTVYAVAPTGMFKLAADATAWTHVNASFPIDNSRMPMAEHNGSLYIASVDEIFTSVDRGETWHMLGPRPKGHAVGFIITDAPQDADSQADITMYLALRDAGVFRSTDGGIHWHPFNDGLTGEIISAVTAVGETVFTGTGRGLYRLDSGTWKKLPVETSRAVYSLTVSGNNLYMGTGPYLLGFTPRATEQIVSKSESHSVRICHSADLGESWTEITHKDYSEAVPSGIGVLAAGETLITLGATESHSTDGGQTWTEFAGDTNMLMVNNLPAVAVNEKTFYKTGPYGIFRTTNGGTSWHLFVNGMMGTRLKDLVVCHNRLYAHTGYEAYESTDEGVSWKKLAIDGNFEVECTVEQSGQNKNKVRVYTLFLSRLIVDDNCLYFLAREKKKLKIFRLSTDGNTLSLVQGIPAFDDRTLSPELLANGTKVKTKRSSDTSKEGDASTPTPPVPGNVEVKTVAVSKDVFYVEYKRGLFKWRLGDPAWINTGLVDTSHMFDSDSRKGLKVAVSGETVYVGKRNGKLFQSLDGGTYWKDVTPSLPLRFIRFNEIAFVRSTVYIATDTGVLVSQTGEHWRVITDSAGARISIDKFAMDGTKIYGINDAGVYHLDTHRQWSQISSEVPNEINALAIANNRLYSATEDRGILHIALEEK